MTTKGVFLDSDSLGRDLDLQALQQLPIDWTFHPFTEPDQTFERCIDAELIITNKVVLDASLITQLSNLRHIAVAATGTNNVDETAAAGAGVSVSNITDYAGSSVAQLVFALLLEMTTNANKYANLVKQGAWSESKTFCLFNYPITELAGKTLGLVGYGALAKSVERLALAFDMKVLVAEHKGATRIRSGRVPFEQAIAEADVLSLHCPLNDKTRALISFEELAEMKPNAFLINTARGGIVNEGALIQALEQRQIAGAAMDVLTQEPPAKSHPFIASMPENLIITPHIAWASLEARQRLLAKLVENIQHFVLR